MLINVNVLQTKKMAAMNYCCCCMCGPRPTIYKEGKPSARVSRSASEMDPHNLDILLADKCDQSTSNHLHQKVVDNIQPNMDILAPNRQPGQTHSFTLTRPATTMVNCSGNAPPEALWRLTSEPADLTCNGRCGLAAQTAAASWILSMVL